MKFFLRHKVRDLLFDGYEDQFLKTASQFYPDQIAQTKFGWFYGRNNTSSDGVFRIFTGKIDFTKLGLLESWNGHSFNRQSSMNGSKCQTFNHTSAGDLQPPFFLFNNYRLLNFVAQRTTNNQRPFVRMFNADMCRTMELKYEKPEIFKNILSYRYNAGGDQFNYSLEENKCYCHMRR